MIDEDVKDKTSELVQQSHTYYSEAQNQARMPNQRELELLKLIRQELNIPDPHQVQLSVETRCQSVQTKPTSRELQCLEYLALGKSAEEIAIILNISPNTVNWHLKQLFKRWDVVKQTQVVAEGFRRGYLK